MARLVTASSAALPRPGPVLHRTEDPRLGRLENDRVKALRDRLQTGARQHFSVVACLPDASYRPFVQFRNVAANFSFDRLLPGECSIAPSVQQLLNHRSPRGHPGRFTLVVWPLAEARADLA